MYYSELLEQWYTLVHHWLIIVQSTLLYFEESIGKINYYICLLFGGLLFSTAKLMNIDYSPFVVFSTLVSF